MMFFREKHFFLTLNDLPMKKMKRLLARCLMLTILMLNIAHVSPVFAEEGKVVINEVAWDGSLDSSVDEWIELYNPSPVAVDLAGWVILDDVTTEYIITEGVIAPYGYFVIADNVNVFSNRTPDTIIPISLANAGDSLELRDDNDVSIDMVDTSSKWFAGGGTGKASMERINPLGDGSDGDNWNAATTSNGAKGRSGSSILGTPGTINSQYDGFGVRVSFEYSNVAPNGETITIPVVVADAVDLYAFAIDVIYDESVLEFSAVREGDFLTAGSDSTSFYGVLENGNPGTLVVGNARLVNPPNGTDGAGTLFEMDFLVKEGVSRTTGIAFSSNSSVSNSIGDMPANFLALEVNVGAGTAPQFSDVEAKEGADRFSVELTWEGNADNYFVYKKSALGSFDLLGQPEGKSYVDNQNIIPGVEYSYRVVAVLNGVTVQEEVTGSETRGLQGDADRNDRVDGKDLESLARAYGSELGNERYNPLIDFNFDGVIDGGDLVSLGANFGRTF
ncbi:hypothetical protein CVV38_01405 [Candidatus Peregrinibacteria bacterium HGW-Peregrinibacteria-1]|jgi:hypothetical protein|nr:MAG: hypothetical protein CVV38_01405 [Candidatus Peregrinibacteria bacterium HGW-Peregrinibacteria-1]